MKWDTHWLVVNKCQTFKWCYHSQALMMRYICCKQITIIWMLTQTRISLHSTSQQKLSHDGKNLWRKRWGWCTDTLPIFQQGDFKNQPLNNFMFWVVNETLWWLCSLWSRSHDLTIWSLFAFSDLQTFMKWIENMDILMLL